MSDIFSGIDLYYNAAVDSFNNGWEKGKDTYDRQEAERNRAEDRRWAVEDRDQEHAWHLDDVAVAQANRREDRENYIADRNESYRRQDQLNQETWARDDTKMQRYTADLKASGINPMLAAGSGAASQSSVAAPQNPAQHNSSGPSSPSYSSGRANSSRGQGGHYTRSPVEVAQLGIAQSQIDLLRSEAELNRSSAERNRRESGEGMDKRFSQIDAEIDALSRNASTGEENAETNRMRFYSDAADIIARNIVAGINANANARNATVNEERAAAQIREITSRANMTDLQVKEFARLLTEIETDNRQFAFPMYGNPVKSKQLSDQAKERNARRVKNFLDGLTPSNPGPLNTVVERYTDDLLNTMFGGYDK